jgi:hypothetical protein
MTRKIINQIKINLNEKTKKLFLYGKIINKAMLISTVGIIIFFILMIGVGIFAAHCKNQRYASLNMARAEHNVMDITQLGENNQFILPQDAAQSGEIVIIVNDLDIAKNSVQKIATKNGGIVYSTFIAYAYNNIKTGSIIVQIPQENFDLAYFDLKGISNQVVQESSRKIPLRRPVSYPLPQSSDDVSDSSDNFPEKDKLDKKSDAKNENDQNVNGSVNSTVPTVIPRSLQIMQNKGYIKVIFADYGKKDIAGATIKTSIKSNIANIFGYGNKGLNMRENIWLVLAIKLIVLIILVWLILIISKRIISNLQKIKQNKNTAVRQIIKNRKRVIKIAARKKKK